MSSKAVVTLATGMEDPEKVTVALLVAVGAAEGGRDTLMWLAKEGVRLAVPGVAVGVSCSRCPSIADLVDRYVVASGRFMICPLCWDAKGLTDRDRIPSTELGGTVPMWEWIGEDGATTFSF